MVHVKGRITQGDPFSMILYGIIVLPINCSIQHRVQDTENWQQRYMLQVWYAYDSAPASSFSWIRVWFTELCRIGSSLGYRTDPDKRFFIILAANVDLVTENFREDKFEIRTNFRYLGGFGDQTDMLALIIRKKCTTGSNKWTYYHENQ